MCKENKDRSDLKIYIIRKIIALFEYLLQLVTTESASEDKTCSGDSSCHSGGFCQKILDDQQGIFKEPLEADQDSEESVLTRDLPPDEKALVKAIELYCDGGERTAFDCRSNCILSAVCTPANWDSDAGEIPEDLWASIERYPREG